LVKNSFKNDTSFCAFLAVRLNVSDGLNPQCVLIDELHAHKTPDLYGVLETAIGARLQPLILSITTAGFVTTGICIDQRDYGRKVVQGLIEDDSFMFVDYGKNSFKNDTSFCAFLAVRLNVSGSIDMP
jgi:phage terminase large subunit-like protein